MNKTLALLTRYADNILNKYRDPYHGTPLFFDGYDSFTGKPVTWRNVDGTDWEPSNLASQQNLFRLLTALSNLTGDAKYKQAAKDAIAWHFEHANASGLLHWGGHVFLDMKTLKPVGPENKNMVHELKHHYPFYELMHEVNAKATSKLIKAAWQSHIFNWETMELSRHGSYDVSFDEATFWDKPRKMDLEIMREAKGLSFVNIGNDLIYAASMDYQLNGNIKALEWGEFLAWQYVRSRHPVTKLGVYQYTRPMKQSEPPTDESAPNFTFSTFGDRAQRQFGPEYGPVALEANVLFKMDDEALNGPEGIYGAAALAQTTLARQLGQRGQQLMNWNIEGLLAWAKYAYAAETNQYKPMFTDGRDLTGEAFLRYGYYGKPGIQFARRNLTPIVFLSYATAWAATQHAELWPTVASMAKNFGLGAWHEADAQGTATGLSTDADDALLLFGVLEVYKTSKNAAYLELARQLGENIVKKHYHRDTFVPSEKHIYCRFDDVEPLALATLVALEEGKPEAVPVFRSKGGYIHGDALLDDGTKKNIQDILAIYPKTVAA